MDQKKDARDRAQSIPEPTLDSFPFPIAIISQCDGTLRYANPSFSALFEEPLDDQGLPGILDQEQQRQEVLMILREQKSCVIECKTESTTMILEVRAQVLEAKLYFALHVERVPEQPLSDFVSSSIVRHSRSARLDTLTGLLDRPTMDAELEAVLSRVQLDQSQHAFCLIDVDQFRLVNDSYGLVAGDQLLVSLSEMIAAYMRENDLLARVGEDEFAFLMYDCDIMAAKEMAENILQAISKKHFHCNEESFDITASMGLVVIDREVQSAQEIFFQAGAALFAAKDNGRNRLYFYSDKDTAIVRRDVDMRWAMLVEYALRENTFELYAQPIVPLKKPEDRRHYEILLRAYDMQGELLSPSELMQGAEAFDLATRVDRWVVSNLFQWFTETYQQASEAPVFSINLSGQSLADREFEKYVQSQLREFNIPTEKICFEITENAVIKHMQRAEDFIRNLKAMGCQFSLDDFGTGFSSFGYLRSLPVDVIKIDGSFIRSMQDEPMNLAMVKAIIDIAQVMGKKTIAEYVETEAIAEQLLSMGIDFGQGYLFDQPQKLSSVV